MAYPANQPMGFVYGPEGNPARMGRCLDQNGIQVHYSMNGPHIVLHYNLRPLPATASMPPIYQMAQMNHQYGHSTPVMQPGYFQTVASSYPQMQFQAQAQITPQGYQLSAFLGQSQMTPQGHGYQQHPIQGQPYVTPQAYIQTAPQAMVQLAPQSHLETAIPTMVQMAPQSHNEAPTPFFFEDLCNFGRNATVPGPVEQDTPNEVSPVTEDTTDDMEIENNMEKAPSHDMERLDRIQDDNTVPPLDFSREQLDMEGFGPFQDGDNTAMDPGEIDINKVLDDFFGQDGLDSL